MRRGGGNGTRRTVESEDEELEGEGEGDGDAIVDVCSSSKRTTRVGTRALSGDDDSDTCVGKGGSGPSRAGTASRLYMLL